MTIFQIIGLIVLGAGGGAWIAFVQTKRATAWAIREAYKAGREAYSNGTGVEVNPYDGHLEWAWYRGWTSASQERCNMRLVEALDDRERR